MTLSAPFIIAKRQLNNGFRQNAASRALAREAVSIRSQARTLAEDYKNPLLALRLKRVCFSKPP